MQTQLIIACFSQKNLWLVIWTGPKVTHIPKEERQQEKHVSTKHWTNPLRPSLYRYRAATLPLLYASSSAWRYHWGGASDLHLLLTQFCQHVHSQPDLPVFTAMKSPNCKLASAIVYPGLLVSTCSAYVRTVGPLPCFLDHNTDKFRYI